MKRTSVRAGATSLALFAGVAGLTACGNSGNPAATVSSATGRAGSAAASGTAAAASAASSATSAAGSAAGSASQAAASASAEAAKASGTVEAKDQRSDGKTIEVDAATLNGIDGGFVAVHQDLDGKPGPSVGQVQVKQGANKKVVVTFDQPQQSGAFWPMLHIDTATKGKYEFPGPDLPVKSGNDIVMKKITLTVQ